MKAGVLSIGIALLAALLPAGQTQSTDGTAIAQVEAALNKGDAEAARALADAALGASHLGPEERGRLIVYRGLALQLLGEGEAARLAFTRALRSPHLPSQEREEALLQRGILFDERGRTKKAISDYSAVIALKGDFLAPALNNRATIYRRQMRLMEARRDYLAALATNSDMPQYSYYGLGQISEEEGDTKAAIGFYTNALVADPGYVLASDRLAALANPIQPQSAKPQPANAEKLDLDPPRSSLPAVPPDSAPIVLRLPRKRDSKPILHSPSPSKPSSLAENANLLLRPALDAQTAHLQNTQEVQLGAWRSEAEAVYGWKMAVKRTGDALGGLAPHIIAVDIPGRGRFYRLRTSSMAQTALSLCAHLSVAGQDCFLAKD